MTIKKLDQQAIQDQQYLKLQEKINQKKLGTNDPSSKLSSLDFDNDKSRVVATFSARNLINNYSILSGLAGSAQILPMVKANAYGHGVEWVVKTLCNQRNIAGFGVATLVEGVKVRKTLQAAKKKDVRIVVFSQASIWNTDSDELICYAAEEHQLTLVISSYEFLENFYRNKWHEKINHHIKFNTGMNRLGIGMGDLERVLQLCLKTKDKSKLEGVCTHFAESENAQSSLTLKQVERFRKIHSEFQKRQFNLYFHCSNSGAIFNEKKLRLLEWNEWVRPGISLYGYVPDSELSEKGLLPVANLKARVVGVRKIAPGDGLGYNFQFLNLEESPIWVATLSVGYADGLFRSFGGKIESPMSGKSENTNKKKQIQWGAFATSVNDKKELRFVGRVSMDLSFVKVDASCKVGDWVEYWGSSIDTWTQAKKVGTIPYEILTSIGSRVGRVYA